MAWLPINSVPLQFVDENGDPYSGAVLKFYAAGTSTNIAVATAQAGTPTVTSVALNSDGYPEVSGNTVMIFVDQDYKVMLYPTQAAANSNTGEIWSVDNIDPFAVLTLPTNLTDINALTPSDGTVIVGDGTEWVAESGNTARTSLGVGSADSPTFANVTLTGLTTGHVVLANSAGALTALNVTAKGSLIVGDGAGAPTTLAATTNDYVLTLDSGESVGMKWAPIPGVVRDYQAFTSSGTWTKPTDAEFVYVEVWSGGGGGANNTASSANESGGSGGEYLCRMFQASALGATETVTVGAGGAGAANASSANGSTGGASSFGTWLAAVGGNPGLTSAAAVYTTIPRSPIASSAISASPYGVMVLPQAGAGSTAAGGKTIYGGGGGGGADTGGSTGGTSAYGGNGGGGNNTLNTAGTAGTAPGGGGGGSGNNGGGGAGARGEVRVWTF